MYGNLASMQQVQTFQPSPDILTVVHNSPPQAVLLKEPILIHHYKCMCVCMMRKNDVQATIDTATQQYTFASLTFGACSDSTDLYVLPLQLLSAMDLQQL